MNILDSRILLKRSTVAGTTPTVPASSSHTDGTWVSTDIYEGELFLNTVDSRLFTRQGSNIKEIGLNDSLIGTPLTVVKNLTVAETKNLFSTPITLVAAPGAGKIIIIKSCIAKFNYVSLPYSADQIQLKTGGDPVAVENLLLSSAATRFSSFQVLHDAFSLSTDTYLLPNQPLTLTVQTANPSGGNNSLSVLVEYQVLNYSLFF
jgi:hypothetical protein